MSVSIKTQRILTLLTVLAMFVLLVFPVFVLFFRVQTHRNSPPHCDAPVLAVLRGAASRVRVVFAVVHFPLLEACALPSPLCVPLRMVAPMRRQRPRVQVEEEEEALVRLRLFP